MVPIASAQSSAVGSPPSPGPKSTATSPADTGSSPQSSTTWSMQTRPATVRRFPASHTGPRLEACRGTPSPYPSGTTARVVSPAVARPGAVRLGGGRDGRGRVGGLGAGGVGAGVDFQVAGGGPAGRARRLDQFGQQPGAGRGQVEARLDPPVQRQPRYEQPGQY